MRLSTVIFTLLGINLVPGIAIGETAFDCGTLQPATRYYSVYQQFDADYPDTFKMTWFPAKITRQAEFGSIEMPRVVFYFRGTEGRSFSLSDDLQLPFRNFVGPVSNWPFDDETVLRTPGQDRLSLDDYLSSLGIDGVYVTSNNSAATRASAAHLMAHSNDTFLVSATLADGTVNATEFVHLVAECRSSR